MGWMSWAVFLAALLAVGTNAWYLIRYPKGNKRWLRLIDALAIAYFASLYLLLGLERFDLSQFGPTLIRPGIGMLLLLMAADAIYDLERQK